MNDRTSYTDILSILQPTIFQIKRKPFKRIFDILFSLCVLILISPLFYIIYLMIRFSSPGKVVYYHERIGRAGIPFRCYKFRTMYQDADARLKDILDNDTIKQQEWERNFKLKDDPRITPIGSFLRRSSLDELPQFWNVLKGDLSVVGPRPVVKEEIVKHFGPKAYKILSVRPGITGLWQISGRSDTSYEERILLDEKYVDTRNMTLDLKIIVLTIPSMLFSKGAY
jgi:exopolysaccharide production protein ExoY